MSNYERPGLFALTGDSYPHAWCPDRPQSSDIVLTKSAQHTPVQPPRDGGEECYPRYRGRGKIRSNTLVCWSVGFPTIDFLTPETFLLDRDYHRSKRARVRQRDGQIYVRGGSCLLLWSMELSVSGSRLAPSLSIRSRL